MTHITQQLLSLLKALRLGIRGLREGAEARYQREERQRERDEAQCNLQPPPTPVIVNVKNEVPKADEAQQTRRHNQQLGALWAQAAVTFLAFLAAVVYAGYANSQADAANRAAVAAEDSANMARNQTVLAQGALKATVEQFKTDERAWVGVKGYLLTEDVRPNKLIAADCRIGNYGKTPALDMVAETAFNVRDTKLRDGEPLGKLTGNHTVLVPNSDTACPHQEGVINETEMRRIANKTAWFYFYGVVRYRDILAPRTNEHRTRFCSVYDPDVKKFVYCGVFNSAD